MKKDTSSRSNAMQVTALIFFLLALCLIIALRLFENQRFLGWYNSYADTLMSYQEWVEQNGATALSVAIILLNFVLKATIPWFPITIIMFSTGMIFKWYWAILINTVGAIILFTIKYYWGRKWGGGNAEKILGHYDRAHYFIETGKLGSKATLFLARLTPFMPINSVSQLYGTTTMPFGQYLIVSLIGFSYKLFSYTIIARNVYNPLSSGFIVPIMALLIFFGLVLLALDGIISATSPVFKRIIERINKK